MHPLNLPPFDIQIQTIAGNNHVFDQLRKKYVVLTPEEWVRQHFVNLLIHHFGYPRSLMKVESGLKYNKLNKRTDIIVYDREGNTFMVVECKASTVAISQKTLEQVAMYNVALKAKYVTVTNGMVHYCCEVDHLEKKCLFRSALPAFTA